ncbi:hypothetical protein, partial [Corynebacterium flavescens]|uniref:hypothetical protein n=1 Tax=Corynebacterium flavescens TaxID=28028 RepID=UPI003FD39A8D
LSHPSPSSPKGEITVNTHKETALSVRADKTESAEQVVKHPAQHCTQVQEEPKLLVFHLVLNLRRVEEGKDGTIRTMCGESIETRDSTRARSRAAVQRLPKSVLCPDCEALRELEAGLGI